MPTCGNSYRLILLTSVRPESRLSAGQRECNETRSRRVVHDNVARGTSTATIWRAVEMVWRHNLEVRPGS